MKKVIILKDVFESQNNVNRNPKIERKNTSSSFSKNSYNNTTGAINLSATRKVGISKLPFPR